MLVAGTSLFFSDSFASRQQQCVHRAPHCTHACAHFSREVLTSDAWRLAQGLDDFVCLRKIIPSSVMSLVGVPSRSFTPIFSSPCCSLHLQLNQKFTLRLCSMEWNVWLCCQSDSRQRRSISSTATGISRTITTRQSWPPQRILMYLDIPELQAAASTQQQQAEFPPCRNWVH